MGIVFREVALIGAGAKFSTVGKVLAGWQWTTGLLQMVCNRHASDFDRASFALDTLVVVLVLKGGPTNINVPRLNWREFINSGGVANWGAVVDSYVIRVNTQAVAEAVAGAQSGGWRCFTPASCSLPCSRSSALARVGAAVLAACSARSSPIWS